MLKCVTLEPRDLECRGTLGKSCLSDLGFAVAEILYTAADDAFLSKYPVMDSFEREETHGAGAVTQSETKAPTLPPQAEPHAL